MDEQRVVISTLPPEAGLAVSVRDREDDSVLMSGVLDSGGYWQECHDMDTERPVSLVLENDDGKELIRCRVPLRALNPMECLMKDPPKLTPDELHKRFRRKYREMKARGVESPDPEAVARQAFKYD